MPETINPYSPPHSDPLPKSLDKSRPASSKWMIALSFVVVGGICWVNYELIKESGLSESMAVYADYPLLTIASAILLVAPVLMLRRRPGWPGYLLGGLNSFALAGYFTWRVIYQVANWTPEVPVTYLLVGVAFALPFLVLFVRFVFGQPSRRFHGIGAQRVLRANQV